MKLFIKQTEKGEFIKRTKVRYAGQAPYILRDRLPCFLKFDEATKQYYFPADKY